MSSSPRRFSISTRIVTLIAVSGLWLPLAASADEGDSRTLYQEYCSVCHGDRGDGQSHARQGIVPPPRDFTEAGLGERLDRDTMIRIVADGKPGTAMAGWKPRLDDAQIAGIVDYIREHFMVDATASTPTDRGRAIYARSCSVCHGDDGRGAVWTRSGLNPVPRDFTAADPVTDLDRDHMISSVYYGVDGTAMQSFTRQLDVEEIHAVVDYIRQAFMGVRGEAVAATDTPPERHDHAAHAAAHAEGDTKSHADGDDHAHADTAAHGHGQETGDADGHGAEHAHADGDDHADAGSQAHADASFDAHDQDKGDGDGHTHADGHGHEQEHADGDARQDHPQPDAVAMGDDAAGYPNGLTADADAGRNLYMANCTACHGANGDGAGPRAYFIFPKPRNFISDKSRMRFKPTSLYYAIRDGVAGKEMPAWRFVLSEQQMVDIAEYVHRAYILGEG